MTFTVLLIALAHGIPIFLAGAYWNTKLSVTLVALVMCVVAVATGGSQYTIVDLLAIGIVYFLCIRVVGNSPSIKGELPPKQTEAEPAQPKAEESWVGGIIGLIVVGVFLYNKATDKPAPSPPAVAQVPQQANVAPKPLQSTHSEQPANSQKTTTANGSRSNRNTDLRHCLKLPTDAAIMRCANQGK